MKMTVVLFLIVIFLNAAFYCIDQAFLKTQIIMVIMSIPVLFLILMSKRECNSGRYDVSCSFEMPYFFKFNILVLRCTNLMIAGWEGEGKNDLVVTLHIDGKELFQQCGRNAPKNNHGKCTRGEGEVSL